MRVTRRVSTESEGEELEYGKHAANFELGMRGMRGMRENSVHLAGIKGMNRRREEKDGFL